MRPSILYAVFLCAVASGFIGWRVHAVHHLQARHIVIIEDLSLSHNAPCDSLAGLIAEALRTTNIPPSSVLTVLALGDSSTRNEPYRLAVYPIPTTQKVIEGRSALFTAREEVLGEVSRLCRDARRPTISPLFLGITQAVAELRAEGCTEVSNCQIFVDSDLDENADSATRRVFQGSRDDGNVLSARIDNAGINVTLCGVAATAGLLPRDSMREDRIRRVWVSQFAKPNDVSIEPFCPAVASSTSSQRH